MKKKKQHRRRTFKEIRAAAWPASEQELAEVVVAWLEKRGWEVYQEVMAWTGGPIADIVAKKDGLYWIIECKRRLNLTVLAQAARWGEHAHLVSVAMPRDLTNGSWEIEFARSVCRQFSIGWLSVRRDAVSVPLTAPERPGLLASQLDDSVCEEHKTHAKAGSDHGGNFTPFKRTVASFKAYVTDHPGCSVMQAVRGIDHHYRTNQSASAALRKLIEKKVIQGISLRKEGRSQALYGV